MSVSFLISQAKSRQSKIYLGSLKPKRDNSAIIRQAAIAIQSAIFKAH